MSRRIPRDPCSVVVAIPIGSGLETASWRLANSIADLAIEDDDWPYEVLGSERGEVWIALSWPEGHEQVTAEQLAAEAISYTTYRVVKFGH